MRRKGRQTSGEQSWGEGGSQSGHESACVIRPLNQWKVGPAWPDPVTPLGLRNSQPGRRDGLILSPDRGGGRGATWLSPLKVHFREAGSRSGDPAAAPP